MKTNSLVFKLFLLIIGTYSVTVFSILAVGNRQILREIDRSLHAEYGEKLLAVLGMIERKVARLRATGMEEAYEDDFKESVLDTLRIEYYESGKHQSYLFIIDSDGAVVIHPDYPYGDRSLAGTEYVARLLESKSGELIFKSETGERNWYVFKYFDEWDWLVGFVVPEKIKYAGARRFRNIIILTTAMITVFIALLLATIAAKFVRPITRLTKASMAMAGGDLDQAVDVGSNDELGILARNFALMRDAIQSKISELEEENAKRRRAEKRVTALIDALPDIIYFKDTEGRNLVVNRSFAELTGHKKEEAQGKKDMELLPPELAEHCKKQDEEVIRGGKLMRYEEEHAFHGEKRFQETIKVPLYDERGVVTGLVGITRDITERKRAEIELKKSEEKFRNLFESATDAIFILDLEGNIIDINTVAHTRLGYTKDEMLSMHKKQLNPPEFASKVPERMAEVQHKGMAVFESAHIRKDGTLVPVEINASLLNYGGRQVYFSISRDITERKKVENALHETNQTLGALISHSPLAIICTDIETKVLVWNPAAERIFGWREDEVLGGNNPIIPEDKKDEYDELRKGVQHGGPYISKELVRQKKDGTPIYLSASSSALLDAEGNVNALMGIFEDITERKKTDKEIQKSLKEKEVLLKEIHHRVKNNMAIISSLLQLQARYSKNETVNRLFRDSQSRIGSMALVHEKLYQTKDFANINFREYVEELVRHLLGTYGKEEGDIELLLSISDTNLNIDTMIPCGLMLNELVTNSLKYAFEGVERPGISISFDAHDGQAHLVYGDNGSGIPEHVDFPSSDSLGLQLVNMLSLQLKGTVKLERNGGTRFTIDFKVATQE